MVAMRSIETTTDRIRIFENTIRLSAGILIVLANAIRKMKNRLIAVVREPIISHNVPAILNNSFDKKKDRNHSYGFRREMGFFFFYLSVRIVKPARDADNSN